MRNTLTIPEVRCRLYELADELGVEELRDLAAQMQRKSAIRRAKPTSTPIDANLAKEIRKFARKNPTLHQRHIAEHFNVNPGRVSESLNHYR